VIIELTSADLSADPRLDDYTRLKDVKLRSKIEPERGLYMAESANVIERAIRAGHRPRSFLMSARWLESLTPLIERATGSGDGADVPVFVAEEDVLEHMTGFHLHRGALAAMQRPLLPSLGELLATARDGAPARRVVVLENLVDHTNVGAAFRSAAALGVGAVLGTPHGAGRLMSRTAAKENLSMDEFRETMSNVYTTAVNENTLDEAPMAYKSLTDIIDVIEDSVDVIELLKPIYNFKAG